MGVQDELWKDVIEGLFPQFLSFFAPDLSQDVDWERGYEFLDKELHQITPESESLMSLISIDPTDPHPASAAGRKWRSESVRSVESSMGSVIGAGARGGAGILGQGLPPADVHDLLSALG